MVVDLRRVIGELTDFFAPQADAARVVMRTSLPDEPVAVCLDVNLLKQALLNLMIDALQAMPGGGELLIKVSRQRRMAMVEVIDTGTGMSAEQLSRIFQVYYSTKSRGMGLGLPTTRRIIREHGGTIQVDSEVGKGTRFIIQLPLNKEESQEMKIVFIGGGAYAWTSELVRDIAVTPSLHGSEICLMDIDSEPLKLTAELSRKVVEVAGAGIGITSTTDQDAALTGADCVVVAINTGAWQAMAQDLEVPLKYGIRHSVSDTVGPGGISRALRNVPVLDGIARRVHEVCPRAWLINLTNPMSTLTRVMRAGHDRTVGYCHEIEWLRLRLAHRFNVPREKIHAVTVGVNHMTWVMELHVAGNPSGLEMLREDVARRGVLDDRGKPTPIVQELYELFGAAGVAGRAHRGVLRPVCPPRDIRPLPQPPARRARGIRCPRKSPQKSSGDDRRRRADLPGAFDGAGQRGDRRTGRPRGVRRRGQPAQHRPGPQPAAGRGDRNRGHLRPRQREIATVPAAAARAGQARSSSTACPRN